MMTPTVWLTSGVDKIDLNNQSTYFLHTTFTPPAAEIRPVFGAGGAARYDAADVSDLQSFNLAYSLDVAVHGASAYEMRGLIAKVRNFLAGINYRNAPTYLEYNTGALPYKPLWGQGGWIRYEILFGAVDLLDGYSVGARAASDLDVRIRMILNPIPLGLEQRLASASGGVLEDAFETGDGASRGVMVPPATTNVVSNPSFESGTTGWASVLSATLERYTADAFVGESSMRVTTAGSNTGGASYTYTTAVGGSWTAQARIKAASPHSVGKIMQLWVRINYTDVTITEGSMATITLSSDWQMAVSSVTANGAKTVSSLIIYIRDNLSAGETRALLVDGVQLENRAYASAYCDGSLGPAYSWSGTAHASTSSRTAAAVTLASGVGINSSGTLKIIWRAGNSSTSLSGAGTFYLFKCGSLVVYYNGANNWMYAQFNGIAAGAVSFAAGDVVVIHVVWNAASTYLYVNGALIDSDTSGSGASLSTMYIGGLAADGLAGGTYQSTETYAEQISATEVAADAADILALTASGGRYGCVPYIWNSTVNNCIDSTYKNYAVAAGIPGDFPAQTVLTGGMSTGADFLLSLLPLDYRTWGSPVDLGLFVDCNDGAYADATCCGGYYLPRSISTSGSSLQSTGTLDRILGISSSTQARYISALAGKEFYGLTRLYDEGANLTWTIASSYGYTTTWVEGDYSPVATSANFLLLVTNSAITAPQELWKVTAYGPTTAWYVRLWGKRTTGTANVRTDWVALAPRPLAKVGGGYAGLSRGFVMQERTAFSTYSGATEMALTVTGDVIELEPGKNNLLMSYMGVGAVPFIDWSLAYTIYITPRYAIL